MPKIEIDLRDPSEEIPPLNTDIVAIVESSIDLGRGFKRHHEFRVLKVLPEDADGDEDEGSVIYRELQDKTVAWEDAQLRLEAGIEEIDDFYSDSIVWWAEIPAIPERGDES